MANILDLFPTRPTITVVDIGAMALEGESDPYQPLIDAGVVNIVGFEPVEEELAKLRKKSIPGRIYLPYAIGDGTVQRFHVCNYPMTSSLLLPDHALTDHFSDLSELMQVVKTVEMKTHRLDDIPEVRNADFIKLDIQGAELQVLDSARHVLKKTLMVLSEVEFAPLYKDQPLFGDIDSFLRSQGFLFHRFSHLSGRSFRPLRQLNHAYSQVLWGDAFFCKDFRHLDQLGPESLTKLAILAHIQCNSIDLAHKCLVAYDRLMDRSLAPAYLDLLAEG